MRGLPVSLLRGTVAKSDAAGRLGSDRAQDLRSLQVLVVSVLRYFTGITSLRIKMIRD